MIVMTTASNQTLSIIPTRETDGANSIFLEFVNETTKTIYTRQALNLSSVKDIFTFSNNTLDFLKEGVFFSLKVYFQNTNEIIFKDRIFCTNQSKESYSINQNAYQVPTIDNNDYITI